MRNKRTLTILDITVFGMLGGLMYVSKLAMEFLPNIHMLGTFIVAITVVYRFRALYPIYVFVFLEGLFSGFSTWWIPYLYIWLPLWGITMLLPGNMPKKIAPAIYCIISGLHGLLYGTLYAPFQALAFGLNFKGMVAWIIAGLPFDCIHAVGNVICGLLIMPLIKVLTYCRKQV